jgi:neutral ceramidase
LIEAGFHEEKLEFPTGIAMSGYYTIRARNAVGYHDPLKVRALYIESGGESLIILSLDLIAVDLNLSNELRRKIERILGIPRTNILVTATHTHSGPEIGSLGILGDAMGLTLPLEIEELRIHIIEKAFVAIEKAVRKILPSKLYIWESSIQGLCANRIDPGKPQDPRVISLLIENVNRERSALINLACHPTVLGSDNRLYSNDFLFYLEQGLKGSIESLDSVVFVNGACGNLSTRFTRRESSYEEADRIGRSIASRIVEGYRFRTELKVLELMSLGKEIFIKLSNALEKSFNSNHNELNLNALYGSPSSIPSKRAFAIALGIEIRGKLAKLLKERGAAYVEGEVNVMKASIGKNKCLTLVGIPGEAFAEHGIRIRSLVKCGLTIIAGYSNGYIGYLPAHGYEGEYETLISLVGVEGAEKLIWVIEDMLKNLLH